MNKHIYITILAFFLFLFSYSQEIKLQKGDTIHKKVKLTFNEEAIRENEFLVFEINNDFNFDNLTLLINGEETKETTFKIYATKSDIIVPIDFFLTEDASSGKYLFSMKLLESSNKLKGNVNYKGKKEIPSKVYLLPKPKWLKSIIYGFIGIVLLSLIFFIYKRSITFSRGTILITEPKSRNFKLKGLTKFDSKKEGCFFETGISFILKKGKNGHPKIVSKSKDTVLYINNKSESTGNLVKRNYTVKLIKGENLIVFKYI